ncbi:hypothetical protein WJX73_006828 [Symbiochloris irregularis]|uniref:Uncharacterized protein n=1 Tax=Symbiochloris irregularis TaxID=706552 RepID=A0AAW1PP71_9CHLO
MAADAQSFGISLGVNAALGILCLFIFSVLRKLSITKKFFAPKRYLASDVQQVRPRPCSSSLLGWIQPTLAATDDEVILVAGVDAALYLKIIVFGLELFIVVTIFVLIAVLPTNLVGKEVARLQAAGSQNQYSALDHVTMSNIGRKSSLLWLHAVATWIISLYAFWMLRRYSRKAMALHLQHFGLVQKGAESHSVLVTDIPGIESGRPADRIDDLLCCLPKGIKSKVKRRMMIADRKATEKADEQKSRLPGGDADNTGAEKPPDGQSKMDMPRPGTTDFLGSSANQDLLEYHNASQAQEKGAAIRPDLELGDAPAANKVSIPQWVEVDAVAASNHKMLAGVPAEKVVEEEFVHLYPGEIKAIHMVYDADDLDDLVSEYDKLKGKALDLIDTYATKMRKGKKVKRKTTRVIGWKYGTWGQENYGKKPVKVDALDWYMARITQLRKEILQETPGATDVASSTAFVTFSNRRAQMMASQCMQHHDQRAWHVQTAPGADEIVWSNLKWRSWERRWRAYVIWTLFALLALFYYIPIGAVQALVEVQRLQNIPGFKQLLQITFIKSLLQSIFPSLVLKIFLAVLPLILAYMNKRQGMISKSQIDFGVTLKLFIFQVLTVFVGSFVAGSFFTQFETWIKDPKSAVTIIGTSAPLTSIFFLNYIEFGALATIPLSSLRIFPLIIFLVTTAFSGTERSKRKRWSNSWLKYGKQVPLLTMTILLGLTFSVINPLVPAMCVVYFLSAYLVDKYRLLYIERPAYQSGGQLWKHVFEQIIVGLLWFQVIMIALLGIKQSYAAILVAPTVLATFMVRSSCLTLFRRPLLVQSVHAAVDLDAYDRTATQQEEENAQHMYLAPAFKFSMQECDAVLTEVDEMRQVLNGERELAPEAAIADVEAIERTEWRDAQGDGTSMSHMRDDAVQMARRRSHALGEV